MTTQLAKIHRFLFSLLVLFLPIQLGIHFWPDWTRVLGLRIDYLSPTLYFTDLLVLGILVSWIAEKMTKRHSGLSRIPFGKLRASRFWMRSFRSLTRMTKTQAFLFLSFFVFLLINCFLSANQPAAFYKLIKITEFFLLGFYIFKNSFQIENFKFQISLAVVYSSLLAIAQFLKQGSLGGIFYWLGERSFNAGTPGIAQAVWKGQLLLRPYATFPHPNVLAGFLVVGLLLMINQNFRHAEIFSASVSNKERILKQVQDDVTKVAFVLGTIALFLTFSHTAWVVFVLGILALALCRHCEHMHCVQCKPGRGPAVAGLRRYASRNDVFKVIGLLILLFFNFYFLFSVFPIQSESITYRQDLNLAAIREWQSSPLLGVGLNNFLVRLPEFYQSNGEIRWFQPAHNFFLMILAEMGLVGLIGLMWFLIKTIHHLLITTNYQILTTLVAILVLGFFDHYFYTLQQGQLLLTIVLGLCWSISTCGKIDP